MSPSGDQVYRTVLRQSGLEIIEILTVLKTHVKKENVAVESAPKYFEALSIAMDSPDPAIQSLAFSLICHLVKRISIQDRLGSILLQQGFLVLPMLLPKIADPKQTTVLSARRALEAYWLSSPKVVEQQIRDSGLSNRNPLLVNECVVWLNHILTSINLHFKLDQFFDALASILVKYLGDAPLVDNVKILLANYYELEHNKIHLYELQRVLERRGVSQNLRTQIMSVVGISGRTGKVKVLLNSRPTQHEKLKLDTPQRSRELSQQLHTDCKDTLEQGDGPSTLPDAIETILLSLPNYNQETSVNKIDVEDPESILQMISEMLPCFASKETERNWVPREKSILKLRGMLRGNPGSVYIHEYLSGVRDMAEGIQKALLSLRTTLSVNTCQLVKELTVEFKHQFDGIADILFPTLNRLCSATKQLTHTNANVAICAIFAHCSVNVRLAHRIVAASTDKSASTRAYAALWLQILILRAQSEGTLSNYSDSISKVLVRLLGDANMQVRQKSKDAYWKLSFFEPELASDLSSRLEANVLKALERARPSNGAPVLQPAKSRPSLKSLIMAKNKQIRTREGISRGGSRNAHREDISLIPDTPALKAEEMPTSTMMPKSPSLFRSRSLQVGPPVKAEHESPHPVAPRPSSASLMQRGKMPANPQPTLRSELERIFDRQPKLASLKNHTLIEGPNLETSMEQAESPRAQTKDPITRQLQSGKDSTIEDGVNDLHLALLKGAHIDSDTCQAARKVSLTHAKFFACFFESEKSILLLKKLLLPVELLRIYAVAVETKNVPVTSIIGVMEVNEVYDSAASILSWIADLDNIEDERSFIMQIIKFKSKILATVIDYLLAACSKLPIKNVQFDSITSLLFDLVPIMHTSSVNEAYKSLLRELYSINNIVFANLLENSPGSRRAEVERLVGIVNASAFKTDVTLFNTDLTKINAGDSLTRLSPLKRPSDFTMLLPPREIMTEKDSFNASAPDFKLSPNLRLTGTETGLQSQKLVLPENMPEDADMEEADVSKQLQSEPLDLSPSGDCSPSTVTDNGSIDNIFLRLDESMENSPFYPKGGLNDESMHIADDLAQVQLSNKASVIESMLDKLDPLKDISSRSKTIAIFEDETAGSPQKLKEYNYSDYNWFNYLLARLSLEDTSTMSKRNDVETFRASVRAISSRKTDSNVFLWLLESIQGDQEEDFRIFMETSGYQLLETAIWESFLSTDRNDLISTMILLKQILINHRRVNLERLWEMLVYLSGTVDDVDGEIDCAIEEVLDEAFCGLFTSEELFWQISASFHVPQLDTPTADFVLRALGKLVSAKSLSLVISDEFVKKVDQKLRPYMTHDDAAVRKLVFTIYGHLLRAQKSCNSPNEMELLLQNLLGPQKKLVEYFGN